MWNYFSLYWFINSLSNEQSLENRCKLRDSIKLKGVTPHTTPILSKQGGYIFSIISPFTGEEVRSRSFKSHLIKHGTCIEDYILKINNMTWDDIPMCPYCGIRKCRIGGARNHVDLLNPIITPCCSDPKCGIKLRNYRQWDTLESEGRLYEISNKRLETMKELGINPFEKPNSDGYFKSEIITKEVLDELNIKHVSGNEAIYLSKKVVNESGSGRFAILDFYLPYYALNIECDGSMHRLPDRKERDKIRDVKLLKYLGIKTYRISGGVLYDKELCKSQILLALKSCELLETPKDITPQ